MRGPSPRSAGSLSQAEREKIMKFNKKVLKLNNFRYPFGYSLNKYNLKLSSILSYYNLKKKKERVN